MKAGEYLFLKQFYRELLIHSRQLKVVLNVCLFFIMLLVIFPLTLPADPKLMQTVLPGLLWMAMLLSFLLSADRLFQSDYDYGVMEQWLISGKSLSLILAAKIMAQWLVNLLPVLLLCPFISLLFSLSLWETTVLALGLICGTPAILFLCALAAAFTLGVHQRGALMALILLPLTLPVMIFGSATLYSATQGFSIKGHVALLTAMSILAVSFLPTAIAAVVRVALSE